MTNNHYPMVWKNLRTNPPDEACYLTVAFKNNGVIDDYSIMVYDPQKGVTYRFRNEWNKPSDFAAEEILYINLNEIVEG